MERTPFAHGAMRECFRMKKMSQVSSSFFFTMNWEHCDNYVAKRYMKADTPSSTYFDDVKMQMVAKRYASLYNRRAPPKPVDVSQREGSNRITQRLPLTQTARRPYRRSSCRRS